MLTLNTPPLEPGKSCVVEELNGLLSGRIPNEVIKRFDAVVPFKALEQDDARLIIRRGLEELHRALKPRQIGLRVQEQAYEVLMKKGYTADKGADELPALLESHVVRPAYDMIDAGDVPSGATINVTVQSGEIALMPVR